MRHKILTTKERIKRNKNCNKRWQSNHPHYSLHYNRINCGWYDDLPNRIAQWQNEIEVKNRSLNRIEKLKDEGLKGVIANEDTKRKIRDGYFESLELKIKRYRLILRRYKSGIFPYDKKTIRGKV